MCCFSSNKKLVYFESVFQSFKLIQLLKCLHLHENWRVTCKHVCISPIMFRVIHKHVNIIISKIHDISTPKILNPSFPNVIDVTINEFYNYLYMLHFYMYGKKCKELSDSTCFTLPLHVTPTFGGQKSLLNMLHLHHLL